MTTLKTAMPKLQAYLSNEILKRHGELCLEDRLEAAYNIIKEQPKIYEKLKDNHFFKNFVQVTQLLVEQKDKANLISLIDFSYIVLHDKEDIKDEYFEIKREIESNKNFKSQSEKPHTHKRKM